VPKEGEIISNNGAIEEDKTVDQIRKSAYSLPSDFEWFLVDLNDEAAVII
jgi:hypothetical protein